MRRRVRANLLGEVYECEDFKIELACDSSAARGLAHRTGVGKKVRHLDIKLLFVQQLVKNRSLCVVPVSGLKNKADLGTKLLDKGRLEYLRKRMLILTDGEFNDEFGPSIANFQVTT